MYYFASAVTAYLVLGTDESPKNLWLASDGLAAGQHAHPNSSSIRRMLRGYFRTHYVASGLGGGTNGLGGPDSFSYENGSILALPGTQVGTADLEYPVYANSPDCIFPNDDAGDIYWNEVPHPEYGSIYTYAFEDGPFGGQAYLYHGVAATQVDTPSFRTMYFSFDFSQLSSAAHRLEWMQDLMDWWEIGPVSADDPQAPGLVTGINSIYPNPFDSHASVSFQSPGLSALTLQVFDTTGRLVRTQPLGNFSAGQHTITWDGRDSLGAGLAPGLYFIRLQGAEQQASAKVVLVR